MNAAKKIRYFIEKNDHPEQVQVLKNLAAARWLGKPFDIRSRYEIDMPYFEAAIELLQDWRLDHHIASRSKLVEQLVIKSLQSPLKPSLAVPSDVVPSGTTKDSSTASQTSPV
jgi:hypothetical protein